MATGCPTKLVGISSSPEGYVESRCLVPAATATPFFRLVDYAQYCLKCLMEGCEEISREDLLKAIDDIIDYLETVVSNVRKTNSP